MPDSTDQAVLEESLALTPAPCLPETTITPALTILFAASVGVIITNLSAPQTLIGLIGPSLGMTTAASSLVAMATLLGYAAGLFFVVPLADLLENRRLTVGMLTGAVVAAGGTALAPGATSLLALLFVLGAACSAIQVLVPIAASMSAPAERGRVIGNVMSGLMLGLLLSRPLASLVASDFGWRAFYAASAVIMAGLAGVLALRLPRRAPVPSLGYGGLIASLWVLLRAEPALRVRSLTAALGMAAFCLYWTTIALRLAQPPFDLGQGGIAVFALAGAGSVLVTPLAGRAGDRGWTTPLTVVAHLAIVAAYALAAWAGGPGTTSPAVGIGLLALCALLLDIGVIGDQTLGRRMINLLQPEARGRLNALFVGLFFIGGAVGSTVAGIAWVSGGWTRVCLYGAGFGVAALIAGWLGREV